MDGLPRAAGKIVDALALFDPSCVSLMPGGALSQVEHEAMGLAFKSAFPNSYMDVDKIVESGNDVVVLGHFRRTHSGDLQSAPGAIPASGKELNLPFIDYFRVEGERIIYHQTIFDQMALLGQVDALPSRYATTNRRASSGSLGLNAQPRGRP